MLIAIKYIAVCAGNAWAEGYFYHQKDWFGTDRRHTKSGLIHEPHLDALALDATGVELLLRLAGNGTVNGNVG